MSAARSCIKTCIVGTIKLGQLGEISCEGCHDQEILHFLYLNKEAWTGNPNLGARKQPDLTMHWKSHVSGFPVNSKTEKLFSQSSTEVINVSVVSGHTRWVRHGSTLRSRRTLVNPHSIWHSRRLSAIFRGKKQSFAFQGADVRVRVLWHVFEGTFKGVGVSSIPWPVWTSEKQRFLMKNGFSLKLPFFLLLTQWYVPAKVTFTLQQSLHPVSCSVRRTLSQQGHP